MGKFFCVRENPLHNLSCSTFCLESRKITPSNISSQVPNEKQRAGWSNRICPSSKTARWRYQTGKDLIRPGTILGERRKKIIRTFCPDSIRERWLVGHRVHQTERTSACFSCLYLWRKKQQRTRYDIHRERLMSCSPATFCRQRTGGNL